jgi:hypothetical protein
MTHICLEKDRIVDAVLHQIELDQKAEDLTALVELLSKIDDALLIGYIEEAL